MTKRLSLADLKVKSAAAVIKNTEIYTGGEESGCHKSPEPIDRCNGGYPRTPPPRN